jgi:hypothetical protein
MGRSNRTCDGSSPAADPQNSRYFAIYILLHTVKFKEMSSVSDIAKAEGYSSSCTKLLYFRVPLTTNIDFKAAFKSSIAAPEAATMIDQLNSTRQNMFTVLHSAQPFDAKIKAVDAYVPHLLRYFDMATDSEQNIQSDKLILFEWKGTLSERDFFKSSDVLFELIMVLQTKVCLLEFSKTRLQIRFITSAFIIFRHCC